jgi:hypothetical protein
MTYAHPWVEAGHPRELPGAPEELIIPLLNTYRGLGAPRASGGIRTAAISRGATHGWALPMFPYGNCKSNFQRKQYFATWGSGGKLMIVLGVVNAKASD